RLLDDHAVVVLVLDSVLVDGFLVTGEEIDDGVGVDSCRWEPNLSGPPLFDAIRLQTQRLRVEL
ncbi:MAG: hypothetical protein MK125_07370, partial [Dehalococcoidia bacterium]|nr:hypothetical protein [Dehalococcoidia bacterium]